LIRPASRPPRLLPPFPTRRSSDLTGRSFAVDREDQVIVSLRGRARVRGELRPRRGAACHLARDAASEVAEPGPQRPFVEIHLHRSEEHTSELHSRENLVCRLLLAK